MSVKGITIDVFEYELKGYNRGYNKTNITHAETNPQVYTSELRVGDSNTCSVITDQSESKGADPESETRSCDVLSGILSGGASADGGKIVTNFLSDSAVTGDIIMKPGNSLPELHLSDLLYLTTQYPTKIPKNCRPDRILDTYDDKGISCTYTPFNTVLAARPTLQAFYESSLSSSSKDFVVPLVSTIVAALKPDWQKMHDTTTAELTALKSNLPTSVSKTLIDTLRNRSPLSDITDLS